MIWPENKNDRLHGIVFSAFALALALLLYYAYSTGWLFFNGNAGAESWSSSGPGYHK